jgi:hypothetical protein
MGTGVGSQGFTRVRVRVSRFAGLIAGWVQIPTVRKATTMTMKDELYQSKIE